MSKLLSRKWTSYLLAVFGVAVVTAVLVPLNRTINATTAGFAFLLVVVFVAILWGSKPALLASFLSMLCFNFFFLPPLYTLSTSLASHGGEDHSLGSTCFTSDIK
jgi:two-component system sensor histidine kinase KdpD